MIERIFRVTRRVLRVLPLPLVHFAVMVKSDRIYVLGRQDRSDRLHADIYSARISGERIGSWERARSLPVPLSRFTCSVHMDLMIVAGGGFGWAAPIFADVYTATIGKNGHISGWRKSGVLPRPVAFHAAVLWLDEPDATRKFE